MDQVFYGNTVAAWLSCLGIIAAFAVAAKLIYVLIQKFVKQAASKNNTRIDDIIIDMVEEPFVFGLVLMGFWYGLHSLNLSKGVENLIGKSYYLLVIFNVAWLVNRFFGAVLREYVEPYVQKSEGRLDDQLLPIIKRLLRIFIWITAAIVALNNAGYDVGALIAGLGIGGLAFALAAKDTLANLFGGVTIFLDKPFKIKDRIQVNGYDGSVVEVGLRSTRIQTLAGRTVTIPNASIVNNTIENVSSEPSRKISMTLGLTYDMSHEQVQQGLDKLKQIVESKPNDLESKYIATFSSFGDFSLNILFIYYIKKGADVMAVQSDVNFEILKRFNANGLEFAFPTQTLYNISPS